MTTLFALPLITAALIAPSSVLAHAGHAAGADWHWHAGDTLGLLLVAGSACVAWWLSRGKRK